MLLTQADHSKSVIGIKSIRNKLNKAFIALKIKKYVHGDNNKYISAVKKHLRIRFQFKINHTRTKC